MNFLELSNKIEEALKTKDLENVVKYLQSLNTKNEKEISKKLKKKFPKLTDDDIDLAITLM